MRCACAARLSSESALDLPSLADSVRSVEERIARQNADYEALNDLYEKARDAQLAAGTRADMLASAEHRRTPRLRSSNIACANCRPRWPRLMPSPSRRAPGPRRRCASQSAHRARRVPCAKRSARAMPTSHKPFIRSASVMPSSSPCSARSARRSFPLSNPARRRARRLRARTQGGRRAGGDARPRLAGEPPIGRRAYNAFSRRVRGQGRSAPTGRRETAGKNTYLEILRTRNWREVYNQNMFASGRQDRGGAERARGKASGMQSIWKTMATALNTKVTEQNKTGCETERRENGRGGGVCQEGARRRRRLSGRVPSCSAEIAEANGERKHGEAQLAAPRKDLAELRSQMRTKTRRTKGAIAADELPSRGANRGAGDRVQHP